METILRDDVGSSPHWVHLYMVHRISPARSGGVSFSGDIQDLPGQGPLQPAVGDPASAGALD